MDGWMDEHAQWIALAEEGCHFVLLKFLNSILRSMSVLFLHIKTQFRKKTF